MIKKSFIKIIAYILVIIGLFYNLVSANQDTDIKQINKIDAFILCKNYSTLATLSNLISKKIIRKEDIKEG
jgi:hypothetical protein